MVPRSGKVVHFPPLSTRSWRNFGEYFCICRGYIILHLHFVDDMLTFSGADLQYARNLKLLPRSDEILFGQREICSVMGVGVQEDIIIDWSRAL